MSTWKLVGAILCTALLACACQTSISPDVAATEPPAVASANPAEEWIDHFKIWNATPQAYQRQVRFKGQFDSQPWSAHVLAVEYLANPVEKAVEEHNTQIRFPERHLVGYLLAPTNPPQPKRWVAFWNQLGDARWPIDQPSLLFLPASKVHDGSAPAPPVGLDHYLCYVTTSDEAIVRPIQLVDQFDRRREMVERVQRLLPAYFCVPVEKDGRPLVHRDGHLAIYEIDERTTLAPPIEVETRDQFGSRRLRAPCNLLAVPSIKTGWGEVDAG